MIFKITSITGRYNDSQFLDFIIKVQVHSLILGVETFNSVCTSLHITKLINLRVVKFGIH